MSFTCTLKMKCTNTANSQEVCVYQAVVHHSCHQRHTQRVSFTSSHQHVAQLLRASLRSKHTPQYISSIVYIQQNNFSFANIVLLGERRQPSGDPDYSGVCGFRHRCIRSSPPASTNKHVEQSELCHRIGACFIYTASS